MSAFYFDIYHGKKLGLQINIQKTEYMKYIVMKDAHAHIPSIDGEALKKGVQLQ